MDRYLTELSLLEFNLDADELVKFSGLMSCNDEIPHNSVLQKELAKRNITFSYEMDNSDSTRKWLASLVSGLLTFRVSPTPHQSVILDLR